MIGGYVQQRNSQCFILLIVFVVQMVSVADSRHRGIEIAAFISNDKHKITLLKSNRNEIEMHDTFRWEAKQRHYLPYGFSGQQKILQECIGMWSLQ